MFIKELRALKRALKARGAGAPARARADAEQARLEMEKELRRTRDYLEALIANANVPIVSWDSELHITRFNHACELLTKYDAAEVIGGELSFLFPEGGKNAVLARTPVNSETVEAGISLKHGGTRMVLWNSTGIYEADGKTFAGAIAQGQDITGHRLTEEGLKRDKQTLEKAGRTKALELIDARLELEKAKRLSDIGTLAATVAHELRNPLAAISMAASNIKRKAASPLLEKHLQNIDKKILESNQIISNLLFYSRIRMPQFAAVDITPILEECAVSRGVPIQVDADFSTSHPVEADPVQLKEVFSNIISNACDAVSGCPRGRISIRTTECGKFLRVRIRDTGIGIEKDLLPRIFDPFFTTKAKGTGLGLYVCQQIVKLHDGVITVESEPGKGTTFGINLPRGSRYESKKNTDN